MNPYTPPDPFVLDHDYQVSYYARLYEEVMANINEAESTIGLTPTTWYLYLSATEREPFTPLAGGVEQLVGFNPRFADYILDMRAALDRLYAALGTSTAEVLQARFGVPTWANPGGFYEAKGEVSDRDLEEVRLRPWPEPQAGVIRTWRLLTYGISAIAPPSLPYALARQFIWQEFRVKPLGDCPDHLWGILPTGTGPLLKAGWHIGGVTGFGLPTSFSWLYHEAVFQCIDLSQIVPTIPLEGAGLSLLLSSWSQTLPVLGFRVMVRATTAETFAPADMGSVANALYAGGGVGKGTDLPLPQEGARFLLFPGLARRRYLILGYFVDLALTSWRAANPLPLQHVVGGPWFFVGGGGPQVRVMAL